MKHNWEYKPFKFIADTITPRIKVDKSYYLQSGAIPIISQEESFISGYWNNHDDITPHSNDVIIFGDHSRVLKYVNCEFVVGADGVKIISPKACIFPKFLYHFLKWYNVPSLGYARHFKLIKEAYYPVPQIEVQHQIVAELDKINEVIEDCRELLCNLDALAKSLFYDYFGDPITNPKGWEVNALRDIIIGKLAYGSGASGIPFDGNVRYIRITDIDNNGKLKPEIAASPSAYESKYELKDGDILFARSGATVGKTYLYRSEIGKAIYAGYLIKATVNQNTILPQYLFALGKTSYYWNYIGESIIGVAQPNVNAQSYGSFIVPVPPLELQEKFAERIEQIDEQKKAVEETIANLQTLLDSRMDYWFN